MQVVTILKALMATAEDYIGEIRTAALTRKEPDKSYTDDEVIIKGITEDGRGYKLRLEFEDEP